jgi:SpoVK/Ycf46/Vps4 family AAA+-type ATPase
MAENASRYSSSPPPTPSPQLPPELIRKGRLDEIFFVDLPDAATRQEIFRIHLAKRHLDPERFDLAALAEASEGFTGAEIEESIVSARYLASTRSDNNKGHRSRICWPR